MVKEYVIGKIDGLRLINLRLSNLRCAYTICTHLSSQGSCSGYNDRVVFSSSRKKSLSDG
jgi:hypothetical protein